MSHLHNEQKKPETTHQNHRTVLGDPSMERYSGSLIQSSANAQWQGLLLAEQQLPRGIAECKVQGPDLEDHLICIELKGTERVKAKIADCLHEGCPQPGQFIIIRANQAQEWRWKGDPRVLKLYLTPQLMRDVASKTADVDPARVELMNRFLSEDPFIVQLALRLRAELEGDSVAGRLYVETLTQALALHLIKEHSVLAPCLAPCTGGLPKVRLRRVTDYMRAHLDQNVGLEDLATQAGMSAYHFSRLFKESTGDAPYQHMTRLRVERAECLLKKTDLKVSEICRQVGYNDHSHFASLFRRYTGMTPRAFRREHR